MLNSQRDDELINQLNELSKTMRQELSKSLENELNNQKEQILKSQSSQEFNVPDKTKTNDTSLVNELLPLNPSYILQQLKSKFIIPKQHFYYALIKPKGSKKGTRYFMISTFDMRFIYNSTSQEYIPISDIVKISLEDNFLTFINDNEKTQNLYTLKMNRDIFDSVFSSRCSPLLSFMLCFIASGKIIPSLNLITLPFYEKTLFTIDLLFSFKYINSIYTNSELMDLVYQVSIPQFSTVFEYIFSDFISLYRENIDFNAQSYFRGFCSAIFRNDENLNSSVQQLITQKENVFDAYIEFIKTANFNQYTKLTFYLMFKILSKTINAKLPKSLEREHEEIMKTSIIIILRILYYFGITQIVDNSQWEKYEEICTIAPSLEIYQKERIITTFLPLRYQPKDYNIEEYTFDIYAKYIKILKLISEDDKIDIISVIRKYDREVEKTKN